jgi:hypothetical protein
MPLTLDGSSGQGLDGLVAARGRGGGGAARKGGPVDGGGGGGCFLDGLKATAEFL